MAISSFYWDTSTRWNKVRYWYILVGSHIRDILIESSNDRRWYTALLWSYHRYTAYIINIVWLTANKRIILTFVALSSSIYRGVRTGLCSDHLMPASGRREASIVRFIVDTAFLFTRTYEFNDVGCVHMIGGISAVF